MPVREPSPRNVQPDEWGMFDPDQAGLAALIERLEQKRSASAVADERRPAPKPLAALER